MEKRPQKSKRSNRTICLPIPESEYEELVHDARQFRECLDFFIDHHPELFPLTVTRGYRMKDRSFSKKQSLWIRRIEIEGTSYTIRPSFLMPYLSGLTQEVEPPLFLRKFDVPFWALSHVFGKSPIYWYRLEQALGRNSLVGTTVKTPPALPRDIAADEKHTKLLHLKRYVATTVGNECFLGTSVAKEADETQLTQAYGIFQKESRLVDPDYQPTTVNLDGWKATSLAWKSLFPLIVIIPCFLHVFIKIRDRGRKKHKAWFQEIATKLWNAYAATTKKAFSQRIRRLYEWASQREIPDTLLKPIEKLKSNLKDFSKIYDFPNAHRTSNMLDRLMQRMDRRLVSMQYFHGTEKSAELGIRAWALLYNFAPSNPQTIKKWQGARSPAERLNGFVYHENWLENLLVSASLGGYNTPPLNPV